jgi:predicted ATPase
MASTATAAAIEAQDRSIRDQLARLVEAGVLRQAPRQQRLLRHIVEATLAGDAARLKGYTLGVEVFDRGADFDPNVDPIVRIEAGRLRAKLMAYYASAGADDAVVIDIPKGGNAARFVFREALPSAPGRAPAARGQRAWLPVASERIFGRERDVAALLELLAEHRVITVVGTGGVGKTRLAQAAVHARVEADRRSSAGWVDLTRIADASLLPAALAHALDLPIAQRQEPLPALLSAMQPLAALVVFDNAEHLVDAVAHLVHAVRDAAPDVRVLVTSQAPLRIDGERVFRLDALALPAPDASPDDALRAPAVALFVDRVRALGHRVDTSADAVAAITRVCRRLDGLPLAIRLAAAHAPMLGLSALEAQLQRRHLLMYDAGRDVPARQRTLNDTVAWSCGLLAADELALFRQLGVCVGGFTLELAVAMGHEGGADESSVIERLNTLVERSIVNLEPGDPPRYRLLEGQRVFALRQLEAREGELPTARQRHASAVANVLYAGHESLWSTADADWLPRWAPELDNFRAALDWSRAHDTASFVSLVGSSSALFRLLDLCFEMRERAAALDASAVLDVEPDLQARYWLARANLQTGAGAGPYYAFAVQAERVARPMGNPRRLYLALCQRGISGLVPASESRVLLDEIAALESRAWTARLRAVRCSAEFVVHTVEARWAPALDAAQTGFELAREAGTRLMTAAFANYILVALLNLGEVERAYRRSIELRTQILPGPAGIVIPFVGTSARCALLSGDVDGAKQGLVRMFDLCRSVEWAFADFFVDLCVKVALAEGRFDDAARLLGRAEPSAQRAGRWTCLPQSRDSSRAEIEAAIGAERLAELHHEGAALDPEAVSRLTLRVTLRE